MQAQSHPWFNLIAVAMLIGGGLWLSWVQGTAREPSSQQIEWAQDILDSVVRDYDQAM